MIQNLIFVILFFKIFFHAYNFFLHVPLDIIKVFFNSRFSSRKPIKASEKGHSFRNRSSLKKASLILRTSTLLTLKIICSRNTAKKLSQFTNFPANMLLFGVRKNICTAPFSGALELLSWSILKANFCIFLYISLRKFLF